MRTEEFKNKAFKFTILGLMSFAFLQITLINKFPHFGEKSNEVDEGETWSLCDYYVDLKIKFNRQILDSYDFDGLAQIYEC